MAFVVLFSFSDMPFRLGFLFSLVLSFTACSSTEPVDDSVDAFSQRLISLHEVDDFGGIELNGNAVTLHTLGESVGARAQAQSRLGDGVLLSVIVIAPRGEGSESLKSRASNLVVGFMSADFDETTGYVRIGVRNAEALRRAQIQLQVLTPADRENVLLHVARPVFPYLVESSERA